MSRGPGKLQRAILEILGGSTKVFASGSGSFETSELYEELVERDLLTDCDKKIAMNAIRRACDGLVKAGKIEGEYTVALGPGRRPIAWSISGR